MDILNSMIQDVQSGDRKKLLLVIIKLSAAFTVAFLICSFVGKIIYHHVINKYFIDNRPLWFGLSPRNYFLRCYDAFLI